MKITIAQSVYDQLRVALKEKSESAGVLLGFVDTNDGEVVFKANTLRWVPPEHYRVRLADRMAIRSPGWVPAVRSIANSGGTAAFVHTHPHGSAFFSAADDLVDETLADSFCAITGQSHYVSIVIAGSSADPQAIARWRVGNTSWRRAEVIKILGSRLEFLVHPDIEPGTRWDRQARALARNGNSIISNLHVGLVGGGGTGSPIAEHLLRLGIAKLTIVDPDVVTETTLSRGASAGQAHIGTPKVDVVHWFGEHIGSRTRVRALPGDITDQTTIDQLRTCDVIVGATDNHSSRISLNRFAYESMVPVIDCGVVVSHSSAGQPEVFIRISWLAPGHGCLLCRGRIDPVRARIEAMSEREAKALAGEGYVPSLGEPDPAVVTFAALAGAWASSTLVMRTVGIGQADADETIFDLGGHRVSASRRRSRPGCFCQTVSTGGNTQEPAA